MVAHSLSLPLSVFLSQWSKVELCFHSPPWQNRRPQWLSALLCISECILINPFKWALLDFPTAPWSDKQSVMAYISLPSTFFFLMTRLENVTLYSCLPPSSSSMTQGPFRKTASKKIDSMHRTKGPLKVIPEQGLLESSEDVFHLPKPGLRSC